MIFSVFFIYFLSTSLLVLCMSCLLFMSIFVHSQSPIFVLSLNLTHFLVLALPHSLTFYSLAHSLALYAQQLTHIIITHSLTFYLLIHSNFTRLQFYHSFIHFTHSLVHSLAFYSFSITHSDFTHSLTHDLLTQSFAHTHFSDIHSL